MLLAPPLLLLLLRRRALACIRPRLLPFSPPARCLLVAAAVVREPIVHKQLHEKHTAHSMQVSGQEAVAGRAAKHMQNTRAGALCLVREHPTTPHVHKSVSPPHLLSGVDVPRRHAQQAVRVTRVVLNLRGSACQVVNSQPAPRAARDALLHPLGNRSIRGMRSMRSMRWRAMQPRRTAMRRPICTVSNSNTRQGRECASSGHSRPALTVTLVPPTPRGGSLMQARAVSVGSQGRPGAGWADSWPDASVGSSSRPDRALKQ